MRKKQFDLGSLIYVQIRFRIRSISFMTNAILDLKKAIHKFSRQLTLTINLRPTSTLPCLSMYVFYYNYTIFIHKTIYIIVYIYVDVICIKNCMYIRWMYNKNICKTYISAR